MKMKSLKICFFLVSLLVIVIARLAEPPTSGRKFTSPLRAYQWRHPHYFNPRDGEFPDEWNVAFVTVTEQTVNGKIEWSTLPPNCARSDISNPISCYATTNRFYGWNESLLLPEPAQAVLLDDSSRTIEERATMSFAGPAPATLRQSVFSEPADRNIFAQDVSKANETYKLFDSSTDHASKSFAFSFTPESAVMSNNTAFTCVLMPINRMSAAVKAMKLGTTGERLEMGLTCARVQANGTFLVPRNDAKGPMIRTHAFGVPLESGFDAERDVDWSGRQPLLQTVLFADCTNARFFEPSVYGEALVHIPVKCSPTWRRSANMTKEWPCDKTESNVRWMPLTVSLNDDSISREVAFTGDIHNFAGGVDPNVPTIVPFAAVQRRNLQPTTSCGKALPSQDFVRMMQGPAVTADTDFAYTAHGSIDDLNDVLTWVCDFCDWKERTPAPSVAPIVAIASTTVIVAIAAMCVL